MTSIPEDTRGRPPILLDLDKKLITLLKSIRNRGGVVNFSVVKASALALIKSNPTKDFGGLEPTSSWVRSVYRRCKKFSRRAGTTTKPPVPLGIFEECKLTFLTNIKRCITTHNIPPQLVLNAYQTPSSETFCWENDHGNPKFLFCTNQRPYRQKEHNSYICYFIKW